MSLENIPEKYDRDAVLKFLCSAGYKTEIDFIHMPPQEGDHNKHQGVVHVNLRRGKGINTFMEQFNGALIKDFIPDHKGDETMVVAPSKIQGLHNNIKHLKNTGVLKEIENNNTNQQYAPLVFDTNGDRLDFNLGMSSPMRADAPSFKPFEFEADSTLKDAFKASHLLTTVREQLEYYFSDINLAKDKFLKERMDKNGFVGYELIKTFPKLQHNNDATLEIIKKAAETSEEFECQEKMFRVADEAKRKKFVPK